MTKLQLALDVLTTEAAIELVGKTRDYIDIIEIGTPLIKHEGIDVIKVLREKFPDKKLLVDLKTMDAGEYETEFCFSEGADFVTVLGVADSSTVAGAVKSAKAHGGKVIVDLINVPDKLARAKEVASLGADCVAIHSGIDQQNIGHSPFEDLALLEGNIDIPIAVAGGINMSSIDSVLDHHPEIVVVGGAITGAEDPAKAASEIRAHIQ